MQENKKQIFLMLRDPSLIQEIMFIQEITQEKSFTRVVCRMLWSAVEAYKKTPEYQHELNKYQLMEERKQELNKDNDELSDKEQKIKGLISFIEKYDK